MRWVAKLVRWVAKLVRWVAKLVRWVAKLERSWGLRCKLGDTSKEVANTL